MLLAAPSSSSSSASSVSSFRAWESLSFPCSKPHSAFSKPNIIFLNPNPERFSISSASSPHPPSPLVASTTLPSSTAPVLKKRKRYRKPYPGESEGIVQEMRFVAMRLRNDAGSGEKEEEEQAGGGWETWQPSMEGFLKYLVDSKLVFETIERIVDESTDVAHVYFRNTGLERAASLSKDLAWFSQRDIMIPKPSNPGTSYATYLSELAEKSVPSFLCHFYNIYFAHITGGQRIGKKVCDMLLEGRELEFYKWDSDVHELLKGTRENLNNLGEHWTRDEKNTCLREAAKSFRYLGQIVRLIILSKWRRAYSALPFSALLLSRLDKLVTGVVSVAPYLTDAAPGPGWNCTTAMEVDNDGISPFSNTNGSHTAGLVS